MGTIWTDLLFLHGHIHDRELIRRLADTQSTPPPGPCGDSNRTETESRNRDRGNQVNQGAKDLGPPVEHPEARAAGSSEKRPDGI